MPQHWTPRTADTSTALSVALQLEAMRCERYEIGLRHVEKRLMMLYTWSAAEIRANAAWLTWINARDNDVYIRPDGSVGLILVDDLRPAALRRMAHDGLAPALVVETSPGNFQAWVRVSHEPIAAPLATAAARILARRYEGDRASVGWRHFGRLAGYANLKPKHAQRGGLHPYAVLREGDGRRAGLAAYLLAEADEQMRARPPVIQVSAAHHHRALGGWAPGAAYQWYAAKITERQAVSDYSKLDWMVCCGMASANLDVDAAFLACALLDGSPDLAARKVGHVEQYAALTASNVMADPYVTAHRQALSGKTL